MSASGDPGFNSRDEDVADMESAPGPDPNTGQSFNRGLALIVVCIIQMVLGMTLVMVGEKVGPLPEVGGDPLFQPDGGLVIVGDISMFLGTFLLIPALIGWRKGATSGAGRVALIVGAVVGGLASLFLVPRAVVPLITDAGDGYGIVNATCLILPNIATIMLISTAIARWRNGRGGAGRNGTRRRKEWNEEKEGMERGEGRK